MLASCTRHRLPTVGATAPSTSPHEPARLPLLPLQHPIKRYVRSFFSRLCSSVVLLVVQCVHMSHSSPLTVRVTFFSHNPPSPLLAAVLVSLSLLDQFPRLFDPPTCFPRSHCRYRCPDSPLFSCLDQFPLARPPWHPSRPPDSPQKPVKRSKKAAEPAAAPAVADVDLCCVCLDERKCVTLCHAGGIAHLCVCAGCSEGLAVCPICRMDVVAAYRVY